MPGLCIAQSHGTEQHMGGVPIGTMPAVAPKPVVYANSELLTGNLKLAHSVAGGGCRRSG